MHRDKHTLAVTVALEF